MNYFPTWQLPKVIFGNRGINALSLLPLFGYLLFFSDNLSNYLESLNWSIDASAGLFSDYLRRIFLGLFCILVGLFLYLIFCPWEVRVFRDHVEYAEEHKKNFTPRRLHQITEDMKSGSSFWFMLPATVKDRITAISQVNFLDRSLSEDVQTLTVTDREVSTDGYIQKFGLQINEALDLWYEVQMRVRLLPRLFSILFGCSGYLILFYPSARIVWLVFLGFGNDFVPAQPVG